MVHGQRVNISEENIHRVQFEPNYRVSHCAAKFGGKIHKMRQAGIGKNVDLKIELLKWVASQIVEGDVKPAQITTNTEPIVKSHDSFPT